MNWKILVTSHPIMLKAVWRALLGGAFLVLLFQIITTGWFLEAQSGKGEIVFWFGCGLGFIIACLEYAMIEGLRNQWEASISDNTLTKGEIVLLLGILFLCVVVLWIDAAATTLGALQIGFSEEISLIWGVGQLFAFEFLANMALHIRDLAENS